MKNSTYLFHLNSFNDTDHITPIIFKFLEKGENVKVIYLSDYDYENDYRIKFLLEKPNFSISRASRFQHFIQKVIYNRYSLRFFFIISYYIMKLFSKVIKTNLHDVQCAIYEWGSPNKLNFWPAKQLNIPTICIPHGLNIFKNYDVNPHISEIKLKTGKWPNFSDRNFFDAYVVQSLRHFRMSCDWGQNPDKVCVWGSARFDPSWAKLNLNLVERFVPELPNSKMIKIVFFLPHWFYNVDEEKTIDTLRVIASDQSIFLVVKGHTRGSGSLSQSHLEELNKSKNVILNSDAHSPALIEWCDIVINFGSSIGIEAILQKKIIIHPTFLHSNETIFDDEKIVYLASNLDEMIELIDRERKLELNLPSTKDKSDFLKREVFGNRIPHEVLEFYYKNIKNICKKNVI